MLIIAPSQEGNFFDFLQHEGILCVLNEAILMSTQNISFLNTKKENHPKLSQICSYWIFSKGLKNEFEKAVVNESSVF